MHLSIATGMGKLLLLIYAPMLPGEKASPPGIAVMQVGFWAHMQVAQGAHKLVASKHLVFMTAMMVFFSVVIALFKDIPDVRGDSMHDTLTASVRFGVPRIFWTCIWMMNAAYACAIVYVVLNTTGAARFAGVLAEGALCLLLQRRAHAADLQDHDDIVGVYMFVWKQFYAQYLVFPCLFLAG
jgi:homogentisate phytyltransferase/homogentisate geranylgeranyltransferase